MNNYIITTERLGLRHWLPSDAAPFIAMNMDEEVMRYFPRPLIEAESLIMLRRINHHFDTQGYGLYVVEDNTTGEFLGFTGFSIPNFENFFTPCVEIGWRFRKEAWGQGFATEAANACLDYGFNILHLDKIVSFTAVINKRSENVMKRIGMHYVTTFDHPNLNSESDLYRHVLYEITQS
ncbi:MAG: GNAT family N-acetyltransferase [Chitinophagaceae bacterium]